MLEITNVKFELRKGEKNNRKWQGIGFSCEMDGVEHKGIAFAPRDTFGGGEEITVKDD